MVNTKKCALVINIRNIKDTFVFLDYFCIIKCAYGLDKSSGTLEPDFQVLNDGFVSISANNSVPKFSYQQTGVGVRIKS